MATILKYWDEDSGTWKPFMGDVPAPSASIQVKATVTGDVDGSNTTFTTPQPYVGGTLQVYVNGLAQSGYITETDPSTGEFDLDVAPLTGDDIHVYFHVANTAVGNADSLGGYQLSAILEAIYPVGSIYIGSDDGTMPALIANIGTWVRVEGRFIVGVDGGDSDFDYNDTGGEKAHTLTTAEIPSHNHTLTNGTVIFRAVGGDRNQPGAGSNAGFWTVTTNNTGGGGAHNNLPPFKAKYMWERVS